jgi:hypothetical protein
MNLKNEDDSPLIHAYDTIKGGDFLGDQPPILEMCLSAPGIIRMMERLGCPFNRTPEGNLDFRRFGGTLYYRTAFCGASTGQQLRLGPNGQTAWDFFSGAVNPDDAEGSAGAEFPDELHHKLEVAAEEFPDMDAMEVFAEWAKEDYPELLQVLGLGQEDSAPEEPAAEPPAPAPAAPPQGAMPPAQAPMPAPAMENEEQRGIKGAMMSKEGMIKEIAKLVKSRFNEDNPDVGPFNGKENIALDVKKQIAEKFGDKAGEQAEGLAMEFMEKLSQRWEEKHGKVGGDGLARLKELIGNLRGKIESVGDVGGHPGKNIMSAEEAHGALPGAVKVQPNWNKEKNPAPVGTDVHDQGPMIKQMSKKPNSILQAIDRVIGHEPVQESELDVIRKLSGLAK